ncbi:MAG TPA: TetR/AcrR family transcriptional regulator [Ktedonobacterales bacterium]|nr:TetR/AcrR family transcriptional regulator [Ktedonobacterales bacterium]
MPFPRFEKLAPAKRVRLLEASAREFAAFGYAGASINRILEHAQMSKGAAYYYFADKADLFAATVKYCSERLGLIDEALDPTTLTAATFWPTFAALHLAPLLNSFDRPWLFGALKAAGRLDPADIQTGLLAEFAARLRGYVMGMIHQGQALGVIRADLPDELLFGWLQALDRAGDDWLLTQWQQLTPESLARYSDITVEAMRRAVAPDT